MNITDKAAIMARDNLLAYCVGMDSSFEIGRHHKLINNKLKKITDGSLKRAMFFMPPRHGKSRLISHEFAAWWMGHNPNKSVIFTTYNQELANEFGRKVRNRMYEPLFQKAFPECRIVDDSSSAKRFHTTTGCTYYAVGAGGPLTGRGGDLIIIDDPLKNREEASSALIRQKIKDWYTSTLRTRLMTGGSILIVQTRWHMDDISGWLLSQENNEWDVLSLPALNEDGSTLWPEKFNSEFILSAKKDIGSRDFQALYQQNPINDETNLIKRKWFKLYDERPFHTKFIAQFWDTAQQVGISNDYSVCTTWYETDNGFFLVDVWRNKLEFPQLIQSVESLYNKFKPNIVMIEDKSSGSSLIQQLRQKTRIPVIAFNPKMRDKIVRASAITPIIESGSVYVPRIASWLEDYFLELEGFPNLAHDDLVDSTSMALEYLINRNRIKPSVRAL